MKKYARKLYPFLLKCYDMDQTSLEAFSGEYTYSFRDWNTGEKFTLSLREWIENLTEIKKLNGEDFSLDKKEIVFQNKSVGLL